MLVKNSINSKSNVFILKINDNSRINELKNKFLKKILNTYYNVQLDLSKIYYNQYKKPYYIDNIYFNYSHTSNFIALIIGDDEVGIDIEKIREIPNVMINKILNKKELKIINKNKEALECWVLKEAYVKYLGTGIVCDFNKYDKEKILEDNNYISTINNEFCMYAFSKNKINKEIKYYNEEDFIES